MTVKRIDERPDLADGQWACRVYFRRGPRRVMPPSWRLGVVRVSAWRPRAASPDPKATSPREAADSSTLGAVHEPGAVEIAPRLTKRNEGHAVRAIYRHAVTRLAGPQAC
jgi:hypothetical protein